MLICRQDVFSATAHRDVWIVCKKKKILSAFISISSKLYSTKECENKTEDDHPVWKQKAISFIEIKLGISPAHPVIFNEIQFTKQIT